MSIRTLLHATCPSCRARVLETRWDDREDMPPIGDVAWLDTTILDGSQILASVLTGRRLWQITHTLQGPRAAKRTAWWPRRPIAGVTVAAHACGHTFTGLDTVDLARELTPIPDTCPF